MGLDPAGIPPAGAGGGFSSTLFPLLAKANPTWLFPVPQPHAVLDMNPFLFLLDEEQGMALGLT